MIVVIDLDLVLLFDNWKPETNATVLKNLEIDSALAFYFFWQQQQQQ